ncbi:MAG: methylmalonyl-CoA mutase [Rhodothalassiaceae bacterium]|nr:MAG: methylmalonyl-CoA mutase [Rhodothalassiaceae bacterium]
MTVASQQDGWASGGTPAARPGRDRPWIFRTYAGHSSAAASNALYRANLARGQTGLSVAFDLPTQTGHDSDHPLARGEVGKVGVPICHLGDMRTLFDGIPLARMNTSMTINATAAWLLALYLAVAEEQGAERGALRGTVQNDIVKEYLARGTYIFPPAPSLRLIGDVALFCAAEMPKFNPMNVCSYHLQEAGATPEQEVAFALATAIAVLEEVRGRGILDDEAFHRLVGQISFFVNAGMRFITEICKMRAFAELWDEITAERFGVGDPKLRRFRYGVQVNSLGLTEQQPENNVYRILIEMLAVTLSKRARARAVQLPAWNEALGLPREWDQQWSLRAQQILAYETDLLEYEDIFDGSPVIAAKVEEIKRAARGLLRRIEEEGGTIAALESGWMKAELVKSHEARRRRLEAGEEIVVGVNAWTESAPSPLTAEGTPVVTVDEKAEAEQIARLQAWREQRDSKAVAAALAALEEAAREGRNIMPPSIAAAKAGVTTGEWADTLRRVFGDWRAPTGLELAAPADGAQDARLASLRKKVAATARRLGRPVTMLMGKPGLDGHSNGAEQIALRAREAGIRMIYPGIRHTPAELVRQALTEGAHVIGLSVLSGSHVKMVEAVMAELKRAGADHIPVVVGGIIPAADHERLEEMGVARIFTPKDYDVTAIVDELVALVQRHENRLAAVRPARTG